MQITKKRNVIRESTGDRTFNIVNVLLLLLLDIVVLYPLIYVLSTSVSEPAEVIRGRVTFLPRGFNLVGYSQILKYPSFLQSYANTVLYTVVGTALSLVITVIGAYPLSLPKFRLRGKITAFYVFTMYFSGLMIPTFLVVQGVGIFDTKWALILPTMLGAWNVTICRSFLQGIPFSLHESAYIDGANDFTILWRIILPLSKPVMATLGLFCAVAYWNNFFSSLLYVNNRAHYSLQFILRGILMNAQMAAENPTMAAEAANMEASTMNLKTASVVVTMLPILCVYPFIQKYFVKGVMIGSIKG